MSKRFIAVILTAIMAMAAVTGCGKKDETMPKVERGTNSLLVDAEKESVDYAEESEDVPVYGDTDYEYNPETEKTSETDTLTDSDSETDTNTETDKENDATGNGGDNGGRKGGGRPVASRPVVEEHLYEYLWVNGQRYSICDFKLDEFESKIGDSMPYVVYDENLKYDGYFKDRGNFTRGYWTNGKGSTKLFLEVNGNDITAAVVTDLASTDTGMISFGDGASVSMIGVRDIELNEDVTDYSFTRKIGEGSWEQTEDGNIRTYVDNFATATVLIDAEGQNEPVKELMVVGN